MAQSVGLPTLGFGSGHDLRVVELSPALSSVLSTESPPDSLSPLPVSLPCLCMCVHALSLK